MGESLSDRAPLVSRYGLLAAVAIALALRLWNLRAGLPDFLDEAYPFRVALSMSDFSTGAVSWNPHFFRYPSLTIYLFLLLQRAQLAIGSWLGAWRVPADYWLAFQIDASPMVIPARLLCIACDVATVALVVRVGERARRGAGVIAGTIVACSAAMIWMSRTIYTETFLALLGVAAVERMLAWWRSGGRGRLIAATALIGLAAGAKYPGAALLVPLALVLWRRVGLRGLALWPACAAGAGAVFLATTPYALIDRAKFLSDFGAVGEMAAQGHLGNFERIAALYDLRQLAGQLGPIGVALLAASLALVIAAVVKRSWRDASAGAGPASTISDERAVLWLATLVLGLPVALARVETVRYLVPVLPFVALLAAETGLWLAARARARWRLPAVAVVALGLLAPPATSGIDTAASRGDVTRIRARQWLEHNADDRTLIVQETYGVPVLDRSKAFQVHESRIYAAASAPMREAFDRRRWFAAVTLPLIVVGPPDLTVAAPGGRTVNLRIVDQVGDLNQAAYDPRLLAGVDLVITSQNVRARFEADPRYRIPAAFYALLDSTAAVAARFAPARRDGGPVITIYRLTPRTRARIAAYGPLPPLWWLESVAPGYRDAFRRLWGDTARAEALVDSAGTPVPWVASLRPLFTQRYQHLAQELAFELGHRGDHANARPLAAAVLLMCPDELGACFTYTVAARHLDAWGDARWMLERTLAALAAKGEQPPAPAQLEHADILDHLGERSRARAMYEQLARAPDTMLAGIARRRLAGH